MSLALATRGVICQTDVAAVSGVRPSVHLSAVPMRPSSDFGVSLKPDPTAAEGAVTSVLTPSQLQAVPLRPSSDFGVSLKPSPTSAEEE